MAEWRTVEGFADCYEVSDAGEVRTCISHTKLYQFPQRGWPRVYLWYEGKRKAMYVHRLVAIAFIGPCPEGQQCRHLNGIRSDNRAINLAWGDGFDQRADDRRNGVKNGVAPQTHCKNGHEFTKENTLLDKQGYKNCRTCRKEYHKVWYQNQRAYAMEKIK